MSGHRKDKKPAPSGGGLLDCFPLAALAAALLALLLTLPRRTRG